jgi:AcrR family transcriptional regulator
VSQPRREAQSFDRIVAIAAELFQHQGYDATSMQDIAAAGGINKSSLYHHISSKEEILSAICTRTLERLHASLDSAERGGGTPGAIVRKAFEGAARTALSDPRGTSIIIRLQGKTSVSQEIRRWRREYEERFARLIRAAQDSGEVRRDIDGLLSTRLILGMINGLVEWFQPEGGTYSAEAVQQALVAVAATGLAGGDGPLSA